MMAASSSSPKPSADAEADPAAAADVRPAAPATAVALSSTRAQSEQAPADRGATLKAAPAAPVPSPSPSPSGPRRLRVHHETRYAYDAPVEQAHHLAYLRPRDTPEQRVGGWTLEILPPPDQIRLAGGHAAGSAIASTASAASVAAPLPAAEEPAACLLPMLDAWGNWRTAFSHSVVHQGLRVASTFMVDIDPPPRLRPEASPPWESVAARLRYHPGVLAQSEREAIEFSLGSAMAPRDPALARYGATCFPPGQPLLAGALALMDAIHTQFEYRPQATSVTTRAPAALALRKGVCQDFAHVMIGALRSLGLAARYVSGYLLTHPPEGQARLVGADASHAWAAVWCPLHGWVALDPTNNVPVGQDHVTLAWGRDYGDVAPLRGVIRGNGRAVPQVGVTVEPVELAGLVGQDEAG